TGEMIALIQANFLGQMRTGAASGIASKYLARKDSASVGLFGTGRQAHTQLLAVSKVLPITHASVWSPTEANRKAFAAEMSATVGIEVIPVATAEEAARHHDVLITATSAR